MQLWVLAWEQGVGTMEDASVSVYFWFWPNILLQFVWFSATILANFCVVFGFRTMFAFDRQTGEQYIQFHLAEVWPNYSASVKLHASCSVIVHKRWKGDGSGRQTDIQNLDIYASDVEVTIMFCSFLFIFIAVVSLTYRKSTANVT